MRLFKSGITNIKVLASLHKHNEKEWPSEYICKFLEPGLVSYEDCDAGVNLLRKETIIKMLSSFKGKPVISKIHRDISEQNFQQHAVGYITEAWWDDATGWAWAKMLITDDSAKDLIRKGYSISCAFKVIPPTGSGGEFHAIKYTEEILDGEFEHMALVLNPRYEDAEILQNARVLVNSKLAIMKNNEKPHVESAGNGKWAVVQGDKTLYVGTKEACNRWVRDAENSKDNIKPTKCPECLSKNLTVGDMMSIQKDGMCLKCADHYIGTEGRQNASYRRGDFVRVFVSGQWRTATVERIDGEYATVHVDINGEKVEKEIKISPTTFASSKSNDKQVTISSVHRGSKIIFNGTEYRVIEVEAMPTGYRLHLHTGESLDFSGKDSITVRNKKEKITMWSFFKKNAKSLIDPEKSFVEVDGKKVSLAEMLSVKNTKVADVEELSIDDKFTTEDGSVVTVGDLIESYRLNAKKKDSKDEEKKEDAKDEEKKEDSKCNCNAKDDEEHKKNCSKFKKKDAKDEEKKEDAKDDEEKKEDAKDDEDGEEKKDKKKNVAGDGDEEGKNPETTIKKGNSKDMKHFKVLNSARENASAASMGAGIDMPSDRKARGEKLFG